MTEGYNHPYYKPIADIIECTKNDLSSGEIAILIIDFLEKVKKE